MLPLDTEQQQTNWLKIYKVTNYLVSKISASIF